MASSQRRRQLRDASAQIPVVLLPTPDDLGGSLEFGDTMRSAAASYGMARAFLADLSLQQRGTLRPGLYARPGDHGVSVDLLPLVTQVPA
jgi:hypothetical protein